MATLARWQSMWQQLGGRDSRELFDRLVACYAEPHRKYHTMRHLEECFALLEKVNSRAERVGEIELALWFHDAIYNTRKHDNEKLSAEWARDSALAGGLSTEQADRVFELVLTTRHNAVPAGKDAQILVDIDLGILGADMARFDEYEVQVREEYSWVPGFLYRRERRKILEQFASRPTIYNTEYFRAEYEARARENIARSLARL
jgi:predicted metal-dependent HD superfamily phosphohydrolase